MVESSSAGLSIFDLLARDWALEDSVVQTAFNDDDTAVIFKLASGKLALASTTDAESPKVRTRMELETGRTTIRPRENPVPPTRLMDVVARPDLPIVRFDTIGFAVVGQDGALHQITEGGQVVTRLKPSGDDVTALCASLTGDVIAIARDTDIAIYYTGQMQVVSEIAQGHSVTAMALSPDGSTLAAWGDGTLGLIDLQDPSSPSKAIPCAGEIVEISWRKSGTHLACASADKSIYIVNCANETAQRVEDFPSPVSNTAFSEAGNALVTSGAFRLVSWDSNDLPENDQPGTPLTTGKAGFVVIKAIAAHPERNLVATGYANGLVAIASIGKGEEMMLHQERDTEVNCLGWSKTGEHLAIGYASGKAAIVTFPEQMFK